MISKKLELVSSLAYNPESVLTSKNERSISTITINSTGQEFERNTIETDLGAIGLQETDLVLPSKFSIGAGIGEPRKWFVGAETTFLKTSNFSNELFSNDTSYEDAYSFSLGGFYIPQYNSFSRYWKRMVYRAGVRAENTGLNINNQSIKEFGISLEKRTELFSVTIIKLSIQSPNSPEGRVFRNQLTKSATSIGANYREANRARSDSDFKNKIRICESEASETVYWLNLIERMKWVANENFTSVFKEAKEILALFTSISK